MTPQPPSYTRDLSEPRISEMLKRLCKLPDSAMVTVTVGDLRKVFTASRDHELSTCSSLEGEA